MEAELGRISTMMKIVSLPAALGAVMVMMNADTAEAVPLPACNEPVNCLVFDDFTVYSLELLNAIAGSTTLFDQKSTPGFLNSNAITIGTGANGVDNDNLNIDDPYDTPNNVPQNTFVNYESITLTDPSPTFAGDNTVTSPVGGVDVGGDMWDATTAALRSFFGPGESVVFYFNLNESNQGGDNVLDNGQDMYGWLQVTLTGPNVQPIVFTLSGEGALPGGFASQTTDPNVDGFDGILPEADDLWAHVHGEICVNTGLANPFVHFGECVGGDPAGSVTVNQNLGANQAAFALFNQELSDLILDPNSGYTLVSIDLRMAHIDNGFEQLFILPTEIEITQVPEPTTIAMFLAGLLGLAPFARRHIAA